MKRLHFLAVCSFAFIVLLGVGCAAQATPTTVPTATKPPAPASPAAPTATQASAAPAATTAPAQATPTKTVAQTYAEVMAGWKVPAGKTIKVGYPSKIQFEYAASIMALEMMKEKGFKVEPVEFATSVAAVQGVAVGEADLGALSFATSFSAIEKGSDLRALFESFGMTWRLLATKDVADFKQMAGKPLATGPAGQVTDFLIKRTSIKFGTEPQIIRFQNSEQRAQALIQGQVAATIVGLDTVIDVEKQKPGQFRVLLDYSKEYPELPMASFGSTAKFIVEYPDAVQAFVDAHLIAYRRAYDEPDWFITQARRILPHVKEELIKEQYQEWVVKNRLLDPNGHFSEKDAIATEAFYREGGVITAALPLDKWTNLGFLQNALKKLGTYKFKN